MNPENLQERNAYKDVTVTQFADDELNTIALTITAYNINNDVARRLQDFCYALQACSEMWVKATNDYLTEEGTSWTQGQPTT